MKRKKIKPEFVEFIPEVIKEGILYISTKYATVTHKCPCGCGREVVTPISPTDWTLIWNGDAVSLKPSIGNWSFACKSHYWIDQNKIIWAGKWTPFQISRERERDSRAKNNYYNRSFQRNDQFS